jgi:DNA-binding beta-propeller fold protein YncE
MVRSRSLRPGSTLLVVLFAPFLAACSERFFPPAPLPPLPTPPPATLTVDDVMDDLPQSCAFECGDTCVEPATAFDCPTIKAWDKVPHDDACGKWDGQYPTPVKGLCSAGAPTGESARKAGPFTGGVVLPDGHRIQPAGRNVVFAEKDLVGGFPMSVMPLGTTHYALVSDGGISDNALRLIDVDALAGKGDPVASYVRFPRPDSLFYGMAFLPPGQILASGGGDGKVYAFDVDTAKGTLARAKGRDLDLGLGVDDLPYFAGAIAATADGTRLLVGPSDHADSLVILSLGAADYGKTIGTIALKGTRAVFDIRLDPFDPTGTLFYATDQSQSRLLEIDGKKGVLKRSFALDKNPSQVTFLDATYLVVAETDSDALAVVNRVTGMVEARVPVFEKDAPHGFSPSGITYDPAAKRLYATLAGVNAVEAYDVVPGAPPTITPAGRIPTAWWPTGVMVHTDGSLVVVTGKGVGTGADNQQYTWGEGSITDHLHGSVQHVPSALLGDLTGSTKVVEAARTLDTLDGTAKITCPAGASDFPIPADNQSGPSTQIKHVILVVRENKTYDAVFGDRADLGDGDPKLIMASTAEQQDAIWKNARSIAKGYTNFDNFYTDAEQSIQGHTWTVYGRTTDFMERTWLDIWGRSTRSITTPTSVVDGPKEGGVFTWFADAGIPMDNMGEIIGGGAPDGDYPGLLYAQNRPDIDKSCYMGGRIRLRCDLKPFTYALQTNDHTYGGKGGAAAPEVMIAVNDEAIGLLLDALSHSPTWQDSLLIVTEDDPQDGGDHVDLHRSLLFMASPWIKRGYVSHGHYDMASVYRLVAHIFGMPYHNEMMRHAQAPLDAFTSTPDYTPYTYVPRTIKAPCNSESSPYAIKAAEWDFEDLDDQPGLSGQIMEMMKKSPAERGVSVIPPHRR